MENKRYLRIFILIFALISQGYSQSMVCTKDFCKGYLDATDCPDVPESSNNTIKLESPTPCNCCEFNFEKLPKGEPCIIGSPGVTVPRSICGDRLYCKSSSSDISEATCQPMETPCIKAQDEWDKKRLDGTLGNMEMRPECDRNGDYEVLKCIPGQTCYCLSPTGEKMFGDALFEDNIKMKMKCDCSRKVSQAKQLLTGVDKHIPTLRCSADGNYDPIQCIGNNCLCVDHLTGIPSDEDWFGKFVNISNINEETLWCFDKKLHKRGRYLRKCEIEQMEIENDEQFGVRASECQSDGYYEKVQENYSHKYCVAPNGKLIEDYEVEKTSPLAKDMNCNCARARLLMKKNNRTDLPSCEENGNYKKIQCRKNECRCVDPDGNQIEKQVYKENIKDLPCFESSVNENNN